MDGALFAGEARCLQPPSPLPLSATSLFTLLQPVEEDADLSSFVWPKVEVAVEYCKDLRFTGRY